MCDMKNMIRINRKYVNIILMLIGFGAGQGAIFLAQTALILEKRTELLTNFGTCFSFAMLGILLVDSGSVSIFARGVVQFTKNKNSAKPISDLFWEYTVYRLFISVLIAVCSVSYVFTLAPNGFALGFFIFATPALFIWAFNSAGVFDGLNLSGISGAINAIPYLCAALGLYFGRDLPAWNSGSCAGAMLSIGYFFAVIIQFGILKFKNIKLGFKFPIKNAILTSKDGISMIGIMVPGQLYYRFQLVVSIYWLGPDATAVFIYVKQIVNALSQVLSFVRRAEFSVLVESLEENPKSIFRSIFKVQKAGTAISIIFSLSLLLCGYTLEFIGGGTKHIGIFLMLFSPTVFSVTLVLALQQALIAMSLATAMPISIAIAMMAGAIVSIALIAPLGIVALVIGEIAQHFVNFALNCRIVRRWRRSNRSV